MRSRSESETATAKPVPACRPKQPPEAQSPARRSNSIPDHERPSGAKTGDVRIKMAIPRANACCRGAVPATASEIQPLTLQTRLHGALAFSAFPLRPPDALFE